MNTLDTLYSRKSIRSFNGESITEAELQQILKAAYASPVGRAMYETLHMTVITSGDFLGKWEKHMQSLTGNPDMHPFYGAPMVILVSSAGDPLGNIQYSNAAIVVHNMAIAATELGVGACHIWGAIGVLPGNEALMKGLGLPEGMTPCCAIALGHMDEAYVVREIPENRIKTEYLK